MEQGGCIRSGRHTVSSLRLAALLVADIPQPGIQLVLNKCGGPLACLRHSGGTSLPPSPHAHSRPGILALFLGGWGHLLCPHSWNGGGAFTSPRGAGGRAAGMVLRDVSSSPGSPHPHALHTGLSLFDLGLPHWGLIHELGSPLLLLFLNLRATCPRPPCPIPPYQKAHRLPGAMGTDMFSPSCLPAP